MNDDFEALMIFDWGELQSHLNNCPGFTYSVTVERDMRALHTVITLEVHGGKSSQPIALYQMDHIVEDPSAHIAGSAYIAGSARCVATQMDGEFISVMKKVMRNSKPGAVTCKFCGKECRPHYDEETSIGLIELQVEGDDFVKYGMLDVYKCCSGRCLYDLQCVFERERYRTRVNPVRGEL